MNKSFTRWHRWHLLGWLAYVSYEVVGRFLDYSATPLPIKLWLSASFLLVGSITFYVCYMLVYPRFLRTGRLGALTTALGCVLLLFMGLRALIEEVIYPALLGFHNYTISGSMAYKIGHYTGDNVYLASPLIIVSGAIWAAQAAFLREGENRQLHQEKLAAEMAFLRTQINPHFLFNTLNMLFSMAYPVAKPVADTILKLSELMHYMLYDTPDGQVELQQEIDYLNNYLDLYRLRFPASFHVYFTVTGEPSGHRVTPLLLIPFVENAIKHGVFDDSQNPVYMSLYVDRRHLQFTVRNQRSHLNKDVTTGIGLSNLRQRLALLYPKRHELEIQSAGIVFTTFLQLEW